MLDRTKISAKSSEVKKENSVSLIKKTDLTHSINSPIDHILFLQGTIGNQAVQKLIKSGLIQAKLKIGLVNDIYEQKTDRVADTDVRMREQLVKRQPGDITFLVQRQAGDEVEEEEGSECKYFEAGWIHPRTGKRSDEADWWCKSEDAAKERVIAACPSDCFIYEDGPENYPYRPIPGPPCAHYVAHELGIKEGKDYETCQEGYSVSIEQLQRRGSPVSLPEAKEGDIYIFPGGGHSGVIRDVDPEKARVEVERCTIVSQVVSDWQSGGIAWRR